MNNKVVAWVEDDLDMMKGLKRSLGREGIALREYRNYSDAIDRVDELRGCDLVILDIILPSGKAQIEGEFIGLDLLRTLRKKYRIKAPITVFSVVADAKNVVDRRELETLGAVPLAKFTRLKDVKSLILSQLST